MKSVSVALAVFIAAQGDPDLEWPQWRGPGGSGVSEATGLPERWSASENLLWKVELPGRGVSSPVVADGRIYLTASSGVKGDRLHVLALDRATGKKLWERRFRATSPAQCHPKTCMAAPTPAAGGGRIYALFATNDLFCLDADGDMVWYHALSRDHPFLSNQVGMAASPVLAGDAVILDLETQGGSFAAALDGKTGANRWRIPRPPDLNWVSPLLYKREDGPAEVILQSRFGLSAHEQATGKLLWSHDGKLDAISSPVAAGGSIYLSAGEIVALHPSPGGAPAVRWRGGKLKASTASPLVYRGRVYALSSAGILACADAKDGALLWQERLKGPFSASPVAADGKIYCANEDGAIAVVRVEGEPRFLATNEMGEGILASPAVSGRAIYFRSDKHLWAVGKPAAGD